MQIKTIDDYYEDVYAKFPFIPHSDIQRILKYGFRYIYMIISRGNDLYINTHKLWLYIGRFMNTPLGQFRKYYRQLARRIRQINIWKGKKFDGYYYFALQKYEQENVEAQISKRGRKKKKFNYGTVILYRYLDECKVDQATATHIYRVPYPIDLGCKKFKKEFISTDAELIETRMPLNFKTLCVSENKYDL